MGKVRIHSTTMPASYGLNNRDNFGVPNNLNSKQAWREMVTPGYTPFATTAVVNVSTLRPECLLDTCHDVT